MSKKYCATYTIPLNISENDILQIGRTHLQHFINLNIKMDDCNHMMLKMHLELDDSASIGETEQRNIEHNDSSINGLRQSVQQLKKEMKALKDALQQSKGDVVNQLILNRIDSSPNVDNNTTQESNSSKQSNNKNELSGEHYYTKNVASASEGHQMDTMPEENLKVIDLRRNCVYIKNVESTATRLEWAFCIVKLAYEMNVEIPYDSVIHVVVDSTNHDYYVYFRNADIKEEFLKNRHLLIYDPEKSPLRIFDYSEWGIVDIENVQSSDFSLDAAYSHVIEIAKKMGITNDSQVRDSIDHIDVFSTKSNLLNYSVRFKNEFMRKEFLHRRDVLKQFPEAIFLLISDGGGHKLSFHDINDFSTTVASANVIGIAELMGLSLTTDNFKHIYVLNHIRYQKDDFRLIVEFSSKQVKDEFLEKENKLEEMEYFKYCDFKFSDTNAEKNDVAITYRNRNLATALSFFGLAKQLGCTFTPDKLNHFIKLSIFIGNVYCRFWYWI